MGRRKIEIQPLQDERNRTVTFVKRKAGLFKKAYELSVLCQVDLAVIIVGNNNKIYEFSSVDTKEMMNFYKAHAIHESKQPENYGSYRKRAHLRPTSDAFQDLLPDEKPGDSDYDSDTPEPKRGDQKRAKPNPPPPSIYAQSSNISNRFGQLAAAQNQAQVKSEPDVAVQRPVLRVQIPSDSKSQSDLTENASSVKEDSNKKSSPAELVQPSLNTARYPFGKFKSPDSKKHMPQLPLLGGKLQNLSPSSMNAPQLPVNSSGAFFSSLPQTSPSGQYPPSILPTPVLNQAFNPQYLAQLSAMGFSGSHPMHNSASAMLGGHPPPAANSGQDQAASGDSGQTNGNHEGDPPKFKPPFQQSFMNGDQTPVSGLPSRYMSEIFASPSNIYPPQEWPTGMTPYTSTMALYFPGIASAHGSGPLPINLAFANTGTQAGQRSMSLQTPLSQTVSSQAPMQQDQQGQQNLDYSGQFYRKS